MRRAEPIAGLGGLLTIAGVLIAGVGVTGVLLIVLGLLALAVPVTTLATSGPAKSIGTAVAASALGWIGIVLALIRVLDDATTGNWIVLVGAIVAWVGSWLSMRDDSTPGAVAPDIPRRPAPAP
ncbi:hypothetical protein [Solirubrobacter soli]|uniref:hypothetical protein n=1 Tax=Solirubrobacter soli TaxID=363832 RepID=UPI0004130C91|nr:hypothetical protein [Solirubrobacter soli]